MEKILSFFIPHYADHELLIFQIGLLDKYHIGKIKFIVYDSSPSPIGQDILLKAIGSNELIYREKKYDTSLNTYYLVLRDFCLSEDSSSGTFILPHDEILIIEEKEFYSIENDKLFTCGKHLSFETSSKSIAEYDRAVSTGFNISSNNRNMSFSPQYHATFYPADYLNSFGVFLHDFIQFFGNKNAVFSDFLIFESLKNSMLYYSMASLYIQEKRIKRKSQGTYNHPSKFISSLTPEGKHQLSLLINRFFDDTVINDEIKCDKLSSDLLNITKSSVSLMMPNINRSINLFKYKKNQSKKLLIDRLNIFSAFHLIGDSCTPEDIKLVFSDDCCLANEKVLGLIKILFDEFYNLE